MSGSDHHGRRPVDVSQALGDVLEQQDCADHRPGGARTVNPSGAGRKNPDPLAPRPNAAANRTAVMPYRCR